MREDFIVVARRSSIRRALENPESKLRYDGGEMLAKTGAKIYCVDGQPMKIRHTWRISGYHYANKDAQDTLRTILQAEVK